MSNLIESPRPTTRRRDAPVRDPHEGRATGPTPTPPARAGPRRAPFGRLLLLAVAVSAAGHLLLLWAGRMPRTAPPQPRTELTVVFEPVTPAAPETVPPEIEEGPVEETPAAAAPGEVRPQPPAAERPEVIAPPRAAERAPETRTIAPTTLRAPLAPLEGTPGGIGRRTAPVDERRLEIMRAESLLAARLADLPGAGVPEEPSIGLAEGGGVTVPIPWGGFVPENRKDGAWRAERCAGEDADQADKPGEAEARQSQCD